MLRRLTALLLLLLLAVFTVSEAAHAQLDPARAERCVKATVRVLVTDARGETVASGSGTFVDPKGFVLTNFHVVGHVSIDSGPPGTLLVPGQLVRIATVRDARTPAEVRYLARVVRGDVRLDLALLELVADASGAPLRPNLRVPTVPLGDTLSLAPGAPLYAFGFPLGLRTINVTGGQLTGFQLDADGVVSFLRSDAEFNPGNSGGLLADARGRLVAVPTSVVHGRATLEPVELARPIERLPAEWRASMRRRGVTPRLDGVPMLVAGEHVDDVAVGAIGALSEPELHYFRIPDAPLPPLVVTREPGAGRMALLDARGRVVREATPGAGGSSTVLVLPNDPRPGFVVTRVVDPVERPVRTRLTVDVWDVPRAAPPVPAGETARVVTPMPTPPGTPTVSVEGFVVDGPSGAPLADVYLLVGRPGTDLGRALAALIEGRLPEPTFFSLLAGYAVTDAQGRYRVDGLPARLRYPAAAFVRGRAPLLLELAIAGEAPVITLAPIRLGR